MIYLWLYLGAVLGSFLTYMMYESDVFGNLVDALLWPWTLVLCIWNETRIQAVLYLPDGTRLHEAPIKQLEGYLAGFNAMPDHAVVRGLPVYVWCEVIMRELGRRS